MKLFAPPPRGQRCTGTGAERRRGLSRVPLFLLPLLCLGAVSAQSPPARRSLKTIERFHLDCRNERDREDLTLFANGTVRLKRGPVRMEQMWLEEIGPSRVAAYERRLAAIDRGEVPHHIETVSSEYVERCKLYLELPDRPPEELEFGRRDSLPLALERTLEVGRDILGEVDATATPVGIKTLPHDYAPRVDDVLATRDGRRYRINGFTAEGGGVELEGIDEPLTLYLTREQLFEKFTSIVPRGGR